MEVTCMKLQDSLAACSSPPLCTHSCLEHWNPGEVMHGQHHSQQPQGQAQESHQGLQPVSCSAPGAGEQHHKSPHLTRGDPCPSTALLLHKNWHLGTRADAAGFWLQAHQLTSHTHHGAIYRPKWTFPSPINPQMSIQPTLNTDWFSTLMSTVSHMC